LEIVSYPTKIARMKIVRSVEELSITGVLREVMLGGGRASTRGAWPA